VLRSLFRVNVSLKTAVASSRLSSWVSSGMAETNRSVRFSAVKVVVAGETGAGCDLFWRRRRRAVRVAPPVMRIGVRLWLSIGNSFHENKTPLRAGVVRW